MKNFMKKLSTNIMICIMVIGLYNNYIYASQDSKDMLKDAINNEQVETVILLIQNGVDVNFKYEDGVTPLIHALLMGNTDIFKALIDAGADASVKFAMYVNDQPRSLLFEAIDIQDSNLSKKFITMLIEAGIDINIKNEKGQTPLDYANKLGLPAIANFLIKQGAEIPEEQKDTLQLGIEIGIQREKNIIVIKGLKKGLDINLIQDLTNISLEEINKLRTSM